MTQNLKLPIKTNRLILRPPKLNEAKTINDEIQKIWPQLQEWMSWATPDQKELAATEKFVEGAQSPSIENGVMLSGFCKQTGEFIFSGGLHSVKGKPNEYSTGYWVAHKFQGKGYATEATIETIKYAFSILSAQTIHISYFDTNEKSKHIIERLGFEYTHTEKNALKCHLDGRMMDEHCYIMRSLSKLNTD